MPLYISLSPGSQFELTTFINEADLCLLNQETITQIPAAVVVGAAQNNHQAQALNGPLLLIQIDKETAINRLKSQFSEDQICQKIELFESEEIDKIADFVCSEENIDGIKQVIRDFACLGNEVGEQKQIPQQTTVDQEFDQQINEVPEQHSELNQQQSHDENLENEPSIEQYDNLKSSEINSQLKLSDVQTPSEIPTDNAAILLQQLEIQNKILDQKLSDSALELENKRLRHLTAELLSRLTNQPTYSTPLELARPLESRLDITKQSKLYSNQVSAQIFNKQTVKGSKSSISFNNIPNQIPLTFICKICLEPFLHPITLLCGHTFCSKCALLNEEYNSKSCAECAKTYQELPYIDVYLQQKVNSQLNFDFTLRINDFARQINGEFCKILDIQRSHYDFTTRSLSIDPSLPKIEIARIQTKSEEKRTELFNLIKFSPVYCRVSPRISPGDYIVKITPPTSLSYEISDYTPFIEKFSFLPKLSFAAQNAPIYQLIGFQNDNFQISDQRGNVFETPSTDEFFSILTENEPISDPETMCNLCFQPVNLPLNNACGHQFCTFCAGKLLRNNVNCFACGGQITCQNQFFVQRSGSFLEVDFCCIFQGQIQLIAAKFDEILVLQEGSGKRKLINSKDCQEIQFTELMPALRVQNGDLAVQLGKTYNSLAVCAENAISGLYRSGQLFRGNYLTQNIRLVKRTEILDSFCVQCRRTAVRPVKNLCGHLCCRTCLLGSILAGFACFECGCKLDFSTSERLSDQEIDIGTICSKRHSRVASYGSLYGFVRHQQKQSVDVVFACGGQKIAENELVFFSEKNLQKKGRAVLNQLCVVDSGNLAGCYGIYVNCQTKEVLTEVGVKIGGIDDISLVVIVK